MRGYVAVSERFIRFSDMKLYYDQANCVLEYAQKYKVKQKMVPYQDFFLAHLMQSSDVLLDFFFTQRLERYDIEYGTEYCKTLYVWLACERNIVHSAKALFIHRNTMKYRLERIFDLVPLDMDQLEVRIRLLLSLHHLLRENGVSLSFDECARQKPANGDVKE